MRCVRHGRSCGEPPTVITCPAANRYMVRQLLGKGGFARVYRVAQLPRDSEPDTYDSLTSSGEGDACNPIRGEHGSLTGLSEPRGAVLYKHFALKVISKCRLGDSAAGREALRNEISIHRQLDHPAIVKLVTYWEDQYRIYLLMHLVEGPSLEEYVRSRGKLSEPEAVIYAAQIFEALSYLHANKIVHRDLKLANILLSHDLCRVHLCDFGLAAHLDTLATSTNQSMCGTPNYVAPELLTPASIGRHAKKVLPSNYKATKAIGHTPSADAWSMGVALFTMLTGSGPFDSDDLTRTFRRIRTARFTFPIGLKLSPNAKSLVRALLAEDHTRRPSVDEALRHPFFAANEFSKHGASREKRDDCTGRSRLASPGKKGSIAQRDRDVRPHAQRMDIQTVRQRRASQGHRGDSRRLSTPHSEHVVTPRERSSQRHDGRPLVRAVHERTSSLNSRQALERRSTLNRRAGHEVDRRSSLNMRALNARREDGSGISSSGRRSSLMASGMRNDILNLSVTLSAALLKGRKFLDDDRGGKAKVGRKERFESVTAEINGISSAPPLVRRWLDYTSKYGFATLMEDGRIGCCFNDGSIMFFVSEPSELPDVAYIPPKGKNVNMEKSGTGDPQQQADISKKACLCTLFADMILDGGRGSMYDLPSACNVSFLKPESDLSTQVPQSSGEDFKGIVHVRDWARFRNFRATAFRLSNNNIHVKFDVGEDHCDDYVFNPTDSTLFYREAKTGAAWLCPVKYLGEFSSHSEYIHAQLQLCSQAITRFLE